MEVLIEGTHGSNLVHVTMHVHGREWKAEAKCQSDDGMWYLFPNQAIGGGAEAYRSYTLEACCEVWEQDVKRGAEHG